MNDAWSLRCGRRAVCAALLAACLLSMSCLPLAALGLTYEVTDTPGVMRTEEGTVIFADALKGKSSETVIELDMAVGDHLTLKGDFSRGWGSVSFSWGHFDGQSVLSLLDRGIATASDLAWKTEKDTRIAGKMPERNAAVVVGGESQSCEIEAVSVGESAWYLQAVDDAGYSHHIYWVIHVTPNEQGGVTLEAVDDGSNGGVAHKGEGLEAVDDGTSASTAFILVTRLRQKDPDPTPDPGPDPAPKPDPEPDPTPTPTPTPNPTPTPTPTPAQNATSGGSSTKPASGTTKATGSSLPKMGDLPSWAGPVGVVAVVAIASGLLVRWAHRRRDRS